MMNIEDKINLLNMSNEYSLLGKNSQILINYLNQLIDKYDDDESMMLISIIIDNLELYGFNTYENIKKINKFSEFKIKQYEGKQFDYLNSGQLSLLFEIDKNKKIFINAPTSFGKTALVIEYILSKYDKINNVVFVVPTNSLAEEIYIKMLDLNKKFINKKYHITTLPEFTYSNNILILTPERFLTISEQRKFNSEDLLIMDETYKIVSVKNKENDIVNNREYRFRRVLELIAMSDAKSIFLSPYTYEKSESMNEFYKKYNIVDINRKTEYVNQVLIDISTKSKLLKKFNDKEIKIYEKYSNIKYKVINLINSLKGSSTIVYVNEVSKAYDIVSEYSKIVRDSGIDDERYNFFCEHLVNNYSSDNVNVWEVIRGLQCGIGIYVSPMPRYIKREIIRLFNRNIIKNIVVTTAFTEGVNTNAKNLIVTSTSTAKNQALGDIDILNLLGRTGRFGSHSIGNVIIIDNKLYNTVAKVKDASSIIINNINYEKSHNNTKNEYDIEFIDEKYLTEKEKMIKKEIEEKLNILNITKDDLNISFNVPNSWKIKLYEYLKLLPKYEIDMLFENTKELIENEKNKILNGIEKIFVCIKDSNIELNVPIGTPKPFKNDIFKWKELYQLHMNDRIADTLKKKKEYILKKRNNSFDADEWVNDYFDNAGNFKDSKLYIETFKFISNIIEYRIPFYVQFFISVFKMFIDKNYPTDYNSEDIKYEKIVQNIENQGINEKYKDLIDFGISRDIIKKLENNNFSIVNKNIEDIDELNYIDDYEKIILQEYLKYF